MNAEELRASIGKTLPSLFECRPAPRGSARVRTPLLYPDGGVVDVFVTESEGRYCVTDFGEALGWLRMQAPSARRRSPRQNRLIEDTCRTLGVELDRGQLVLRTGVEESIGEVVVLLAQAVVRVSDLWFTLRTSAGQAVAEEVEEWLVERGITFERAVGRGGRSGRDWTIDFETRTSARTALVFLLSVGTRGGVQRITEHVVAGCIDLGHLKLGHDDLVFVSLFDDVGDVWHDDDYRLVEQCSEIANWSRPDELERVLRAG